MQVIGEMEKDTNIFQEIDLVSEHDQYYRQNTMQVK